MRRRATIGYAGSYRTSDAVSVDRFVAEVIVGRLSDPRHLADPRLLAKLTVARVAMQAKGIHQR